MCTVRYMARSLEATIAKEVSKSSLGVLNANLRYRGMYVTTSSSMHTVSLKVGGVRSYSFLCLGNGTHNVGGVRC